MLQRLVKQREHTKFKGMQRESAQQTFSGSYFLLYRLSEQEIHPNIPKDAARKCLPKPLGLLFLGVFGLDDFRPVTDVAVSSEENAGFFGGRSTATPS